MLRLPRIALGTVQSEARTQFIMWALMDALVQTGCEVQHFYSEASFPAYKGALAATGRSSRHLDSWLMPASVCREIFWHGASTCDLALVDGHFDSLRADPCEVPGSSFSTLCNWLFLPRVLVVDAATLADCSLPRRPDGVDGILLDRIAGPGEFMRLQTTLEALWGCPVLGALEALSPLRAQFDSLPRGSTPPPNLCHELGANFLRYSRLNAIRELAARDGFPDVRPALFVDSTELESLTVAVAFDDAFNCYFPDTLDLLESMGATVIDFSPLRDEALPPDTDIVYLGCGQTHLHAECLTANHCMLSAIRNHVRAGRRVYAEGGGLAYLCQHIQTEDGRLTPQVGAFHAIARRSPRPAPARPIEVSLAQDNWLGPEQTTLRGYLNTNWLLDPVGSLSGQLANRGHETDLVRRYQALGSRMHLNLAAQPDILRRFQRAAAAPTVAWAT